MIPGAPPLRLVSVTVIRGTPFCRNEIVEPTALSFSVRPGGQRPGIVGAAELGPVAALRLNSRSSGLPLFQ